MIFMEFFVSEGLRNILLDRPENQLLSRSVHRCHPVLFKINYGEVEQTHGDVKLPVHPAILSI
jgi:hypothetical protein